jgi:sugar lactone lactonase YvrE
MSGTTINDGGPATNAALAIPSGIALDRNGNLYVSDAYERRVRKVGQNGTITTVAGTGEHGYTGDGDLAINARISQPRGIAIDTANNLYIVDYLNYRIRKVDSQGVITTFAGNGDYTFGGDGGPAVAAGLGFPDDVAVSPTGEVYIISSNRLRKVDANGIITTVAGTGPQGFSGDGGLATNAQLFSPQGIAFDRHNNIYIADTYNSRVRKIDASGIISTVAGTGVSTDGGDGSLATNAPLATPSSVAVDTAGVLYITTGRHRVRKIDVAGIISTIAGNGTSNFTGDGGPATNATLNWPSAIKVSLDKTIYFADRDNYRIRKIDVNGQISTVVGGFTGDGGAALNAHLIGNLSYVWGTPANIQVDRMGNLYITSRYTYQIRKVAPSGIISTVAGTGVYGYTGDGGPATQAKLAFPRGIAFDSADNLLFVDQANSRIRRISPNQTISTVAGSGYRNFIGNDYGLGSPEAYNLTTLPIDNVGNLYVFGYGAVGRVTPQGVISIIAGTTASTGFSGDGGPALNAQLGYPCSAAFDAASQSLYIADRYYEDLNSSRIRKIDANGVITTISGGNAYGTLADGVPASMARIDPVSLVFDTEGNLLVADRSSTRIRKIDRDGIISTVAGSGYAGYTGDNGPATSATLQGMAEITVDAANNLYISDGFNRSVRKVTYPIKAKLTAAIPTDCSVNSVTLVALPAGPGFTYTFGPGAVQIGNSNQAVVTASGPYSVTVSTSVFGSPAGSTSMIVNDSGIYSIKAGDWNDPSVWSCNQVPTSTQQVYISHRIILPNTYQAQVKSVTFGEHGQLQMKHPTRLKTSQ